MSTVMEKVTDTVNDVAAALGNTSLTSDKPAETTTGGDSKSTNAAHNEAVLASAAEGRRLYIGNLAYATTEGELTDFFKGYLIESTSIPKNPRTDRPVGYAFVDLSSPGEAERAIAELSGREILERKVSVQLARKPEPAGEKGEPTSGGDASGGEGRRRQSGRGRGRGRGKGGRGGRAARGSKGEEGAELPATTTTTGDVLPLTDTTNKEGTEKTDKDNKGARPPRERRERGPPADGIPSKNKVMVANLPYDLSEEKNWMCTADSRLQLKELFDAYEPSSAKIALRPIPRFMVKKLQARNEPRKGRGFGFVTLSSEEQQQKAVNEMNGKEIEGREIAVKVAIDSPDKTDDDANAPAAEGAVEGTNGADETTAA
ncbi:Single-stranded TG1-3 DNA-binding protein [Lachnellula occidentalis]|uniref:Single-stranded TG1-3 DNA-binding protein n=1 Tax=Lachnellula occidentalis TaxID=215460 RepID=A0A8H8UIC1_9HELO|nr:Single-stranded TG1-3 DNA-binding protein [Lachnellula occidentalis]